MHWLRKHKAQGHDYKESSPSKEKRPPKPSHSHPSPERIPRALLFFQGYFRRKYKIAPYQKPMRSTKNHNLLLVCVEASRRIQYRHMPAQRKKTLRVPETPKTPKRTLPHGALSGMLKYPSQISVTTIMRKHEAPNKTEAVLPTIQSSLIRLKINDPGIICISVSCYLRLTASYDPLDRVPPSQRDK